MSLFNALIETGYLLFLYVGLVMSIGLSFFGSFRKRQSNKPEPISFVIILLALVILFFGKPVHDSFQSKELFRAVTKNSDHEISKRTIIFREDQTILVNEMEADFNCFAIHPYKVIKDTFIFDQVQSRNISFMYLLQNDELIPMYDTSSGKVQYDTLVIIKP